MENKPTPEQEVINAKIDELHELLREKGYKFMFAAISTQEEHPHNIGAMNATIKDLSVLIYELLKNVELDTVRLRLSPQPYCLQMIKTRNCSKASGNSSTRMPHLWKDSKTFSHDPLHHMPLSPQRAKRALLRKAKEIRRILSNTPMQ